MDNPIYTFHVGKKFNSDGSFRKYPGATIICKIPIGTIESNILKECQNSYACLPFCHKFAFLPQSSFHMTAFELLNDQVREKENWSKYLSLNTPMPDVDNFLFNTWQKIGSPGMIRMKVNGCKLGSVLTIALQPVSSEQETSLKKFRDQASEKFGVRKPGHEGYQFHITLAYKLIELDPDENTILAKEIALQNDILMQKLPQITLSPPELVFYDDMSAFHLNITR